MNDGFLFLNQFVQFLFRHISYNKQIDIGIGLKVFFGVRAEYKSEIDIGKIFKTFAERCFDADGVFYNAFQMRQKRIFIVQFIKRQIPEFSKGKQIVTKQAAKFSFCCADGCFYQSGDLS